MSQVPPTPPEPEQTPENNPQSDYVDVELAATNTSSRGKGVLYGCGGAIGCLVILLIGIIGILAVGVQSVADQLTTAFNLPAINISIGDQAPAQIPDDIYVPDVERVRILSQLTTTQYNYAEVVAGQREMPGWLQALYGDNVVMVVVGTIEAGIELDDITQDDITFDELTQTLSIALPAPTLQRCFLDEGQSYVVDRDIAPFAVPMDELEDTLRLSALQYYRDTALEEGILLEAQAEASLSLAELLDVLVNDDGVTISITFEDPLPDAPLPQSCQ